MNNLTHAVADIKKMLNYAKETSIRLSDRNIAWKILLARGAYLESIYDQETVPSELWSAEVTIETEAVTPGNTRGDLILYRGTLPPYYKSAKKDLYPKIGSASGQHQIDVVSERSFFLSVTSGDSILDVVSVAYISGQYVYLYPDVQFISVSVLPPVVPVSVDAFGWNTDLGMSAQSLRDAILEILTKDFQINAAAVSDIVSDMKDQLLVLNSEGGRRK